MNRQNSKPVFTTLCHSFLAIILLFCLNRLYFSTSAESIYFSYNILTLVLLVGLTFLFNKGLIYYKKLSKRRLFFTVCAFLFSCSFTLGTSLIVDGAVTFSVPLIWITLLIFVPFFLYLILVLYTDIYPKLKAFFALPLPDRLSSIYNRLNLPLLAILLFLCWLPILLACYPGIFSYDAQYQSNQVIGDIPLNAHHPVLHTLFLGGCLQLGKVLFGSFNTGMLFYSIIQMLILSTSLAYVLSFMKKRNVAPRYVILCFLFFAWMPFNGILAVCATKDTIFSALFATYITLFVRIALEQDDFFSARKNICFFALLSFVLMALRKNMLYVFLFCIPFLLVSYRKYWKKLLWMFLLPLLLIKLLEGPVYHTFQIPSGDAREAYSVIIQQFGAVYNNTAPDSEEHQLLSALMEDEEWQLYEPHRSDALKDHFRTEVLKEHFSDYLSLWFHLGISYPSQYINAFLNTTYGLWYPNDILPDTTTYRKYIEIYCNGAVSFDSKFPKLLESLERFGMESSYQTLPGVSTLFSPAFYLWLLMLFGTICLYRKQFNRLIPLLPLIGIWGTLLLGPVALFRYMYPLILATPLIYSIPFLSTQTEHDL